MKETTASIAAWQNETFGAARTERELVNRSWNKIDSAFSKAFVFRGPSPRPNLSRAIRAAEELAELIESLVANDDDPKAPSEVADVSIVLAGISAALGHEQADDIDAKMTVNRARRWATAGDGHGQHVEDK